MKYVQVCKALYDYEARTPDELAMKEDDVLYILEEEDDEWWKAELKQASSDASGPVGLVPASYLTECEPIGMVRAEYDYAARQDEELSFEEGQEMLLLENDDPDWYLVKMNNGKIGLAPSNYVQLISETEQKEPHSMEESEEIHEQAEPQPAVQALPPTMPIQPIVPHMTGRSEHSTNREANDDAQSWTVHEYDAVKKKKKKGKGNLLVGNGMICYGSETDKTLPVLKYPILDVTKYLFDGKTLHIEISGSSSTVLDLQASSKSEAKAILVKITDSRSIAQMANTRVNKPSESSLSEPESNNFTTVQHSTTTSSSARQNSYTTTTSSSGQITRRESETASTQESNNPPRWAVIVYAFDAEGGEELTVKDEEQVLVLDSTRTDGWWRVEKTNGEAGLVPSSYVQFNEDVAQHRISAREQQEAALEQKRQEEEERERQRQEEEEYRKQSLAQQRADEARQKEERRIREEEERERRRKAQEASQRAENERRQQMEEEYKRKEEERKKSIQRSATSVSRSVSSAGSSNQLSRSASTSHPATELTKPDSTRVRTWTDRSGAFKVDAELLSYYDGKLRLHKTNGVKIDVPLEKMSMEDIRYVEAHTKHDILKNKEASAAESTSQNKPSLQIEAAPSRSVPPPKQEKKVNPSWDWFDWFLMIGVPMQAALIYSSAFKADKLDDSDLPTLTHKQMKGLGMKEKDVRRVERYIETEKVEPPSDDEKEPEVAAAKTKSQLEKDEELARQLQRAWNDNKDIGQNNEKASSRPKPTKSAPKDVHPDLLEFIGTQFAGDSSSNSQPDKKGKGPQTGSSDLIGFEDDAWTPREKASNEVKPEPVLPAPLQPLQSTQNPTTTSHHQPQSTESITQAQVVPTPTGPSPQQIAEQQAQQLAQEHARQQAQQAQQIQQIQQQAQQWQQHQIQQQAQQLMQKQKLLEQQEQQLLRQKQLQHEEQQQQQQQLQQQQILLQQQIMQEKQKLQQQLELERQKQQLKQQQEFEKQRQLELQQKQFAANSVQGWQTQQLQSQMTGQNFAHSPYYQQPMNAVSVPLSSVLPQPLIPSPTAAGQHMQRTGYGSGLQRSQTMGSGIASQPTGVRNWQTATPENPFGSPSMSPLSPQMTGVQFSTPNPNAFNYNPVQSPQANYLQPQLTGFPVQQQPQQTGLFPNASPAHVFTPNGSMQHGQSGFSQQPMYTGMNQQQGQFGRGW